MGGRIIAAPFDFIRIGQEEFKSIDFVVMGVAFEIQNEMGRLFAESVYRNELSRRLKDRFESVDTEVPISIGFDSFRKTYKADLIIDRKSIFELKAVERTVSQHRSQLLQYLFLANLKHGKLINFSPPKVTGEYVSTSLDFDERRRLKFDFNRFHETDGFALIFKTLMMELLNTWGGFLNLELYYQATEFLLGNHLVVDSIPICVDGHDIGTQKAHLLSNKVAYKITAFTKDTDAYQFELKRFIKHTNLKSIQWVNLNKHEVSFETISRF